MSSSRSSQRRVTVCAVSDIPRRVLLLRVAALVGGTLAAGISRPAVSVAETVSDMQLVESANATCLVPTAGWKKNIASLSGGRIATVFVAEDDNSTNISLVETPVQGDFQKLSSFGSVDRLLDNIAPRNVPENKVFSVKNDLKNNAYVIDYQLKPPGNRSVQHLLTVFSLKPGTYIVTLTCQTSESNWTTKQEELRKVIDSFHLNLDD